MTAWVAMSVLGALGALVRFKIAMAFARHGILSVNLSGAFALGVLTGAEVHGAALLILGTGFLGAFTTFSTWIVERRFLAVSIAGGLAAAALGWALGALL